MLDLGSLGGGTVGGLLADRAGHTPDKTALVFDDETLSYAELDATASAVARGLAGLGFGPGVSVGVFLPNRTETLAAFFGIARAGMVEVPVNTAYKGAFLEHALGHTRVELLLTDPGLLELVAALPERPAALRTVVVLADAAPEAVSLAGVEIVTWRAMLDRGDPSAPFPEVGLGDPVGIMLTSGTTGRSKGAIYPALMPAVAAHEFAVAMQTSADERLYTCLPLFHGAAKLNICLHAVVAGATAVLGRRFSASRFWDEIRRHEVTQFNALGSILPMLLAQPPSDRDREHMARKVFAAPAPPPVLTAVEERFRVHVVEGYGLTEIKTIVWNPIADRKIGSMGVPSATTELEVHDDDGFRVAPGQVGEIVYRPRAPHIMFSGYYHQPDATVETSRDLWWHTGDLGFTDDDGFFYFVDRKKDALRRRGENVSSQEVEAVLLGHPAVAEAAAVGVASDLGEQEVMAVVVAEDGTAIDLKDLFAHCDRAMPHFMVPRYYRVVGTLPATPTGKIRKAALRETGLTDDAWDAEADGLTPTRRRDPKDG
ncbi:AMP-dependent synthetase (plasmid) [Pseudonocardia sp. EC080610-09]|uniref:AMP-binding protein n=1 Tax=unclassified Pseudonocardia TaxID=2619320 RepID=UPI000705DB8A|nr:MULTISPECIES: AMP-binding protein [unclassified Pseudonocardia]ALL79583.1 AMP-dependent synthetase [Pseudonocardia sp. EC080610-09]ALL85463.1 AMP-dependent synthetase [Pseudonocardia sp. EC080619-01]